MARPCGEEEVGREGGLLVIMPDRARTCKASWAKRHAPYRDPMPKLRCETFRRSHQFSQPNRELDGISHCEVLCRKTYEVRG